MNVLASKSHKRASLRKRAAQAAEAEKRESVERLERALKAVRLPLDATHPPSVQIQALERYIASLEDIRADMLAQYGDDRRAWETRLKVERSHAIEELVSLRLEMVQ